VGRVLAGISLIAYVVLAAMTVARIGSAYWYGKRRLSSFV